MNLVVIFPNIDRECPNKSLCRRIIPHGQNKNNKFKVHVIQQTQGHTLPAWGCYHVLSCMQGGWHEKKNNKEYIGSLLASEAIYMHH